MTYGCKNREPFAPSFQAIDGWENSWLPRRVEVPFRMAESCQYTESELGQADKECDGCTHRRNHE